MNTATKHTNKTCSLLTSLMTPQQELDKPRRLLALALLILFGAQAGCGDSLEDEEMSLLMKPEILAVVLDPPEAAPGETVRATALVADDKGVLTQIPPLWSLTASESGESAESQTEDAVLAPVFEFQAARGEKDLVDTEGFSTQTISLMVWTDLEALESGDLPDLSTLATDMESLIRKGSLRMGMRTLMVNEREPRNQNPHVVSLVLRTESGTETELETLTPFEENAQAKRVELATNAPEVPEKSTVTFSVVLEDDGLPEDLRVQWIATGGDFGGTRELSQEWKTEEAAIPDEAAGEKDLRGAESVDPRLDPNLHSIFLIVRDTGTEGNSGQTYVEFYVRVVPNGK